MNTENKNESTNKKQALNNETNKNTSGEPQTFVSKIKKFVAANKLSMFLLLILIVVFSWLTIKITTQKKQFEQERQTLVAVQKSKIDSLQIEHIKFAAEVFSWSVRSELMRNNTENINQLVTTFVQQSGADLVQVINQNDKMILLSSDKKFEGNTSAETNLSNLNATTVLKQENTVTILCPIMGLNDQIGVLLVKLEAN